MTSSKSAKSAGGAESALAAAGLLGPWFGVTRDPGAGWISWDRLVEEPAALDGRVTEAEELLAAGPGSPNVERRVAASIVHLGLVARLISPPLGAAVLCGELPVADTTQVQLDLSGANPLPMTFGPTNAVRRASPQHLARAFTEHWLEPAIEPLTAAVRRSYGLSPLVLWGNVASAVAGALHGAVAAQPDLRSRADRALAALMAEGPLAGTGSRRPDGRFVRHSCCLFYRIRGAGTCADCVLDRR